MRSVIKRLVPVTALVLLVSSGCAVFSSDSDAEVLAEDLATALSEHTLTDVPLVSDSARDAYEELVAPLTESPVKVTVKASGGRSTGLPACSSRASRTATVSPR